MLSKFSGNLLIYEITCVLSWSFDLMLVPAEIRGSPNPTKNPLLGTLNIHPDLPNWAKIFYSHLERQALIINNHNHDNSLFFIFSCQKQHHWSLYEISVLLKFSMWTLTDMVSWIQVFCLKCGLHPAPNHSQYNDVLQRIWGSVSETTTEWDYRCLN